MKTQGKIVILSVALLGAMFLAGLGFLGLLVQTVIDEGAVNDIEGRFLDDEFEAVVTSAELHFEESFENAEIASENSPRERKQSFGGSYEVPDVPVVDGSGEETRSSGDLLSEDGFLGPDEGPDVVSIEMKDTIGKLNDRSSVLGSVGARVREGRPADRMDVPLISHTVSIPVSREGVLVGPSGLDGVEGEFDSIDSDMNGAIGASDDLRAGVSSDEVASTVWTRSNRTTTDSDGDGNPESIYEVKVSVTSTNGTVLNSTLVRVIGMEYIYEDMDSDGFPEHEERSIVRYFNLSIGSRTIAERVAYFNIVKNDTDSNGLVDRIEVRHLSYGYLSIPASVRSVAIAGELILVDGDGDGTFDDREGSAVLFFKKEVGPATVREAALIVSAHVTSSSREMEILRFNRHNSTSGEVLLEEGYVLSYHEGDGGKELLIMAGRNDTVKERVQYVIFNGTKGEDVHVTAFAVENSTIGGVRRSDIVAYDVVFDGEDAAGTLAVGRTDRSNGSLEESFGLVSFERDLEDGVAVYENITVIVGRNVTDGDGLNSTIAYAFREYRDADGDGVFEYLKEARAVSLKVDADIDGNPELEGYHVAYRELVDSDSDGNIELNHTFILMGWKVDADSDGNIDKERALLINKTSKDTNSNGFFEIVEELTLGVLKVDDNSDGVVDHESVSAQSRKVTDQNDDGTSINEETNSWSHSK